MIKKITALFLSLLMLLVMMTACGDKAPAPTPGNSASTTATQETTLAEIPGDEEVMGDMSGGDYPDFTVDPMDHGIVVDDPVEIPEFKVSTNPNDLKDNDMQYVMIYNPNMYSEENTLSMRETGKLGMQVDISMSRADGLGEEEEFTVNTIDQGTLSGDFIFPEANFEADRAGGFAKTYKKGDTASFYKYTMDMQNRDSGNFVCTYAGKYCNIWVFNNTLPDNFSEAYGKYFDEYIYEAEVAVMGEPRFADVGGKINFLYYPMRQGLCGCFCGIDLYSSAELPAMYAAGYKANTDNALLHMNATMASDPELLDLMASTMAHEFQHLICCTDFFESMTSDYMSETWFDEAMSGYIEEYFFPGLKAQTDFLSFHVSDLIKHGQSLYNFYNESGDIGVYGSVHLFSEYLVRLGGEEIFHRYHDYWRETYKLDITNYEALAMALPQQVAADLDSSIHYPSAIRFEDQYQELMSKISLQFYLELLDSDPTDPAIYSLLRPEYLLYDQLVGTTIEGGGRIIVALQDGTFEIPADADSGLIYVGLDKDFNVVTPLVYK